MPLPISLRQRALLTTLLLGALSPLGCTTGKPGGTANAAAPNAKTLRVGVIGNPSSLDPALATDIYTSDLISQCFEGLIRINEKNEIEPCLAEKWEVSPDGKTYIFTLRKGVSFHNGRAIEAKDVKYSWERALNPKTKSPVAVNYLDGVLGVKEVNAGQRSELVGIEVVNPVTLKVTLDRPRAYFLGMLAYPSNYIVCRESVEGNEGKIDGKAMVGTGPFQLESFRPGQQATFKANATYWDGKPKVDRLEMPIVIDPNTAYDSFRTGNLDVVETNLRFYGRDKEANRLQDAYRLTPSAYVSYLTMLSSRQPAFAKPEVRKAFAMAIDRTQIARIAFHGTAQIAHGFVPPQLPEGGQEPPPIPYDPAQAKRLLAQAGYPEGKGFPELTLTIVEQIPENVAVAEITRANLKDNLNIHVAIQIRELGQLLKDRNERKLEFYYLGWVADYPDPQNFLSTLFLSNASLNRFDYSNAKFDALCVQADAERDPKRRAELYAQANRILMEDVGVLPVVYPPRVFLVQKSVQNWRANVCNPLPNALTQK